MKLSQLRAVVAVANCGNFSETALELELTQPAVSHAIATLEEELGVPLFARGACTHIGREQRASLYTFSFHLPCLPAIKPLPFLGQQITWEELATYSPIMIPSTPCGQILHDHLKTVAPSMNTATDIQQDSTIVSMVNQGLRVALLPRLAAAPIPKTVQVYSLPVPLDRVMGVIVL